MSKASFDAAEQQQGFVGLLTRPQLTRQTDPELFRLVRRHSHVLQMWLERLDYRLVPLGSSFRVRRLAANVAVVRPAATAPPRGDLVLALVVAACLEDFQTDSVTTQEISNAVRDQRIHASFVTYDPDRLADRRSLVRAAGFLGKHGVLVRRTQAASLDAWERSGEGVGGGYRIDRDALVVLVDPGDLARARQVPDDHGGSAIESRSDVRGIMLLRQLVEKQWLSLDALSVEELDYYRRQRLRLHRLAEEMTGGEVEERREGVMLVLTPDHRFARDAMVSFPAVNAETWVSLHLLDSAARQAGQAGPGEYRWPSSNVDEAASAIAERFGKRLKKDLQDSPGAIRDASQRVLQDAGLIKVTTQGDWLVAPIAARYRSADLLVSGADGEQPGIRFGEGA